tara:strand:- start:339 stop:713 length:375 start_codon:yes stop_codon:yes gene_type:complete
MPIILEESRIPKILSKFTPINIYAITLGPIIICRDKIPPKTLRHEMIHYHQYKELFYIGFLLIYLYDFLYNAIILNKGFSSQAYRDIRFEQEAYSNDHDKIYLTGRERFAWKNYKLKKEDNTEV